MSFPEAALSITLADKSDSTLIDRLLQLCLHDLSSYGDGEEIGEDGRFAYPYLDLYWIEGGRYPYLIWCENEVAGMALIRSGDPHEMAEFFVLRKYRRRGVAKWAARQLFARHPGQWEVHEMPGNEAAVAFWRQAIPYPYAETVDDQGVTQRFAVPAR